MILIFLNFCIAAVPQHCHKDCVYKLGNFEATSDDLFQANDPEQSDDLFAESHCFTVADESGLCLQYIICIMFKGAAYLESAFFFQTAV